MPLKKDKLLEALSDKRDELKALHQTEEGRTPVICSDEALKEMAKRKPLKTSDFKAIQGLGDVFVERYSEAFLEVIFAHKNSAIKTVNVSKKSRRLLSDYQDRLTDISRRNRNLYTSKLSQRHALDLTLYEEQAALKKMMLFQGSKPIKLTDYKSNDSTALAYHRQLTLLFRETNRVSKETGSYPLYIAYPFVEGRLPKVGFEIKAPLMFFPVRVERKAFDFYLSFDHERDVVINRDLLLANHKFNGIEPLKETIDAQDLTIKNIEKLILPFFKKHHLDITNKGKSAYEFESYENTVKKDFKRYKKGDLTLRNYLVLGNYRIYSSKIQADIATIIANKKYNHLLDDLLQNPYAPYDHTKLTPFKTEDETEVNEKQLSYINPLNYAQEKVLSFIDKHDKVVIWGPPGTGKSQTITSLIAKQIKDSQNVLVVSEKKVALDVIKNRLGYASKFSLFMDDAHDKNTFYAQLKNFIDPLPPVRHHNNDRLSVDETIEKNLVKLEKMHETFYKPGSTTIKVHTIYHRFVQNKQKDKAITFKAVYEAFQKTFPSLDQTLLNSLEKRFDNKNKLRVILQYLKASQSFPIVKRLQTKLTRSEKQDIKAFNEAYEAFLKDDEKRTFLTRRKRRKDFITHHVPKLKCLFKHKRQVKKYLKHLIKDESFYDMVHTNINAFERARHHLNHVDHQALKYLNMLLSAPFDTMENIHLKHHKLFDYFYTGYIEAFEALNQDKVFDLKHYHDLIETIKNAMDEKMAITQEDVAMALYQDALNFSNSKRIMDIKRHLEAKRKWRVSKFIETYQLELFSNIKVWLMTPEVVSEIMPLNFAMYDMVIFDEASQMFVEKAIPTIYRAKKVVIAGDTKQLRPQALGKGRLETDYEDYAEDISPDIALDAQSLLDLAKYKYKETILNYHYRSTYEELIGFSNHAFYEGKLFVSPNHTVPKKPPIEYVVCENGLWENRQNHEEAKMVMTLLKRILRQKESSETIGIITFNVQQRNLIEDSIDQELFKGSVHAKRLIKEMDRFESTQDDSLFVKNIENVQGDERDIIIFSTAYAKNEKGQFLRQFGWLNNEGGENRLNVAVSRAKKKVYVVTSFYPNQLKVEDLKAQGPKRLKSYLQYAYHISNREFNQAQALLEQLSNTEVTLGEEKLSDLQASILKRLEKADLNVETNVGIGGYRLDFAVGLKGDSRYKLGIICDIKHHLGGSHVRNICVHQEKYLKARGWQIYRVLAPSWYKDPNKIMRDIRQHLKN